MNISKTKISLFIYFIILGLVIVDSIFLNFWFLNNSPFAKILDIPLKQSNPVSGGSLITVGTVLYDLIISYLTLFTAYLITKRLTGNIIRITRLFYVGLLYAVFFHILFYLDDINKIPNGYVRYLSIPFPGFIPVLDTYVGIFVVFTIIKNYKKLKLYLYDRRIERITKITSKHDKTITDFLYFAELAITITFLADVMFIALDKTDIFKFIPGFDVLSGLTNSKITPTVGAIASSYGKFFTGPPIGVLIAFILRQIRYREQNKQTKNFPGARILLLFMLLVPVILLLDAGSIIHDALYPSTITNSSNPNPVNSTNASSEPTHILYQLPARFLFGEIILPWFYAVIAITWIFDRYVFSIAWDNLNKKPV